MDTATTVARTCWRCGGGTGLLVCPRCAAPQPLPESADLFAVLGLPRHFGIDGADLENRYHEASRDVHPDRHQTAGGRAGELSLKASAAVNRAYRTLRDPVARARYWLVLHGVALGDANNTVPPALAALVFETQEKLEALRGANGGAPADLRAERGPNGGAPADLRAEVEAIAAVLGERLHALIEELEARDTEWDGGGAPTAASLAELKRRLSEIAYLGTLRGDVERTLGG